MQELLYLVHRIPYPPNKGDKIRSYHLLKHLSQRYRVHLGAFVDDDQDWQYLDQVKALCAQTSFVKLWPQTARIRSLFGLFSNQPLTVHYYRNAQLRAWVEQILCTRPIKHVLVFSSAMAQYVRQVHSSHRIIDFVDVDSDKWKQYAASKPWPLSWLYRRESRLLFNYEKQVAADFDSATFVSESEAALFKQYAPEVAEKIAHFNNGVDAVYFSPDGVYPNPYSENTPVLVFTGAMDYWANIEAVDWFARAVFPAIRARMPQVRFVIVGARPSPEVLALADFPGVTVTGAVPDVRPFLAHAALSVAPLRIARGVQNKVLEAMSMGKIVVATPQAAEGIRAIPGQELFVACDAPDFALHVTMLLQRQDRAAMGTAARIRVLKDYSWENNLKRIDSLLSTDSSGIPNETRAAEFLDLTQEYRSMSLAGKSA